MTIEGSKDPRTSDAVAPFEPFGDPTPGPHSTVGSVWHTVQLVLLDLVLGSVSAMLGLVIVASLSTVAGNQLSNYWHNIVHEVWFPVGLVLGMAASGNYRSSRRTGNQSTFTHMSSYFFAISGGGLLSILLTSVVHRVFNIYEANSTHVIGSIVFAIFLVPVGRSIHRHEVLRRHPIRVLILDSGEALRRYRTHLDLQGGFQIVGWVPGTPLQRGEGLGTIEHLRDICVANNIDQVMVGQVDYPTPVFIDLLRDIQGVAQLTIVPRAFELLSWRSTFTELSGLPLIEAAPLQMSMLDRFVKRTFDLTVSGIALVLASPILLLIGLAVALTSRGPILYRQQRLGRGGRPFTILKFRTMRVEQFSPPAPSVPAAADNAPLFATRNKLSEEERITRVGKLLRKTGLDELPQLWNVLTGAMSIVGPRPFISEESTVAVGWQARRYEVRPGITGLWQVSGRNNLSGEDLAELDYLYVASWSMWWDVKIMWDTPRTMLRGLGAY